jgi:hypothetical protein
MVASLTMVFDLCQQEPSRMVLDETVGHWSLRALVSGLCGSEMKY